MSSRGLGDLARPATILAGVALLAHAVVSPALIAQGGEMSDILRSGLARVSFSALLAGLFLLVLGLAALHARQVQAAGRPGTVPLVLALTGVLFLFGVTYILVFAAPGILAMAPEWFDTPPPFVLVSFLSFGPPWVLYWVVSLRAGVLPRRVTIFLIVASALAIGPILPFGLLLLGAGLVWLGTKLEVASTLNPARSIG